MFLNPLEIQDSTTVKVEFLNFQKFSTLIDGHVVNLDENYTVEAAVPQQFSSPLEAQFVEAT